MISYELSLGLSVVPVFMILGNLNLSQITKWQVENGWLLLPFTNGNFSLAKAALMIPVAISFVIFSISLFAETNRLPFDLPEAETELVGGYHTEYSSMKFAWFFLGEYAAMVAGSALIVTLFLGGWHLPGIPDGAGNGGFAFLHALPDWLWGFVNIGVFFAKVGAFLIFFIWVRWTLPRFRFDQLMRLGWIWFFEIALVNIFLTAGILALFPN
jgi:NADH-quinone oxidoreductase subunit H